LQGKSDRTQQAYVRAVRMLAEYFHTPPDQLTDEQIRQYFLYVKNTRAPPGAAAPVLADAPPSGVAVSGWRRWPGAASACFRPSLRQHAAKSLSSREAGGRDYQNYNTPQKLDSILRCKIC
jgi:hypothetical protein